MVSQNTKCTDGYVKLDLVSCYKFPRLLYSPFPGSSHISDVHGSSNPTRWRAIAVRWDVQTCSSVLPPQVRVPMPSAMLGRYTLVPFTTMVDWEVCIPCMLSPPERGWSERPSKRRRLG